MLIYIMAFAAALFLIKTAENSKKQIYQASTLYRCNRNTFLGRGM